MSGFAASRNRRFLIDSKNCRGQTSSTESDVRVGAFPGEANQTLHLPVYFEIQMANSGLITVSRM